MKDREKKGFIVSYAVDIDGKMIGDFAGQYTGLPLFLVDEPDEEPEEL